jgi:hypothetical protein
MREGIEDPEEYSILKMTVDNEQPSEEGRRRRETSPMLKLKGNV